MTVALQTPEILIVINNLISNIVAFIEIWGTIIFWILLLFFCVWVVWNVFEVASDIIRKGY